MSELKVIAGSSNAKHHAVKAFVVFKSSDDALPSPRQYMSVVRARSLTGLAIRR